MTRLHFIVEGQTEKAFVDRIITPHLSQFGVMCDTEMVITNPKLRAKGGLSNYKKPRNHILNRMKRDSKPDSYLTTMFDLYALPSDFPEYDIAKKLNDPYKQVKKLEEALSSDINKSRFIPYIQLHEFEALLFSDISQMDWEYLEHDRGIEALVQLESSFNNPELINDGPTTAPSKRIIEEIPEYKDSKSSVGPLVAEKIGLTTIRQKCSHFDKWVKKLERLNQT